jgi:ATP-dependent helicase HepA
LPLVAWSNLAERFSGAMPGGKAIGAFRRNAAAQRRLRLLGPGDPFVEALWDFTESDDRGRAFALWRARPYWNYDETLFACFDLRVRPDIAPAAEVAGADAPHVREALRRRAESYLAPVTERVWLTARGQPVQGEKLLRVLDAPYNDRASDQTIRPEAWHRIDEHVRRDEWASWCFALRDRAHSVAAMRAGLKAACEAAAAQAESDSAEAAGRLFARRERASREAGEREIEVGAALARGLRAPTFGTDAAGIVVMASKPLAEPAHD